MLVYNTTYQLVIFLKVFTIWYYKRLWNLIEARPHPRPFWIIWNRKISFCKRHHRLFFYALQHQCVQNSLTSLMLTIKVNIIKRQRRWELKTCQDYFLFFYFFLKDKLKVHSSGAEQCIYIPQNYFGILQISNVLLRYCPSF